MQWGQPMTFDNLGAAGGAFGGREGKRICCLLRVDPVAWSVEPAQWGPYTGVDP